ncbi:MAG: putative PurR-regulated permease PerM [Moritella sp.]
MSIKEWPLVGEKIYDFVSLASSNIESVVVKHSDEIKSLVSKGAALVGSLGGVFMAGVGTLFVGVPVIGFWMLLVLLVAIIQLPPILALLPVILYVFSVDTTTTAVLFLVWCIVINVVFLNFFHVNVYLFRVTASDVN